MRMRFAEWISALAVAAFFLSALPGCGASHEGITGPPAVGAPSEDARETPTPPPADTASDAAETDAAPPTPQPPPPSTPTDTLRFWMADVGQGLGTFFISPEGRVVVIDAGTRGGGRNLIELMRSEGVQTVDLAIITHAHNDHMGGFQDVITNFEVRRFLDPGFEHTSNVYLNLLRQIEEAQIPLFIGETGARIRVDAYTEIELLAPSQPFFAGSRSDVNSNGIVVLVHFGAHRFLIMGDAEEPTERRLVAEGNLVPVDVINVSHHGSRHSTIPELLELTTPQIAVISSGANNSYGHPAPETLGRLEAAGVAEIYRNDLHGHILFESNGEVLSVSPQRVP